MAVAWAQWLVTAGGIYAAVGLLFGLWFVGPGVGRIDPVARGGTRGFRILIFPGVVALWPLLAMRLGRGVTQPPDERNPHRDRGSEIAS